MFCLSLGLVVQQLSCYWDLYFPPNLQDWERRRE
jgi:hypothetical protein